MSPRDATTLVDIDRSEELTELLCVFSLAQDDISKTNMTNDDIDG